MISDEKLQQVIGFHPHWGQKRVLNSDSRDIVICSGRRWGKSLIAAYIALKTLLEDNTHTWIISPTYDLSQKVFDYLVKWFLKAAPSQSQGISYRPFPRIKTARGSWVECKSAENPTGLLGEELDLRIVDEAARIPKRIEETYLFPTTASRQGRSFYISTPFGKNWFYYKWLETEDRFKFRSIDNPHFPKKEWERAKEKLPESVFNQEYMAQFLESAATVFRGVRDIIDNTLKEPEQGHRYFIGLDLAKLRDFTVLTVVDRETHNVVFWDRFQKISYPLQIDRIESVANRYNGRLIVETNNVGLSVIDELRARGLAVDDFTTIGTVSKDFNKKGTKERLINKLSVDIENKNIHIPDIEILVDELESYGYDMTPSGNFTYSAPVGKHDDCVMSLALANWPLKGKTRERIIEARRVEPPRKKIFQYF